MRMTSRAVRALCLMLEVAHRGGTTTPVRLSEVARITGISKKFLEQIALALKSHSLIVGIAGRRGGYVLARPAPEISLQQIVAAIEGPINLSVDRNECVYCMRHEFCECRMIWALLEQRVDSLLSGYSLADLSNKETLNEIRLELEGTRSP